MTDSRAPWGSLNRAAIVDEAVRITRTEGSGGLSIRGLAARMAVSPMALYRHVDNLEDIVDEVVNHLLTDQWRPTLAPDRDWQRWIIDAADRLRRLLVDEPAALQLYLRRPVVSPTAIERMRACLDVLRGALGDDGLARSAYAAVQSYTIGFAALEAAREANAAAAATAEGRATTAEDVPLHELAAYASPTQFREGLRFLLQGVTDRAAPAS